MRSKGFTLIELAIVLVIIGIILGAILRGQDLIDNARAKKIASNVYGYEAAIWGYYDKFGKFPGDTNNDSIIDSPPNATGELRNNFPQLLGNPLVGENYTVENCTNGTIVVNCIRVLNLPGRLAIFVDSHIDGIANGTGGRFIRNDTSAEWPNNETKINATYYFDRRP